MKIHNKRENRRIKKAKTIKTIKGTALLLAVILLGIVIVKFCVDLLMASETEETGNKYVDTDTVTWVASFTVQEVDTGEVDDEGNAITEKVAVYDTDSNGEIIKVPVPAGYVASIIEGETSIKTGFVIYEGDSSIWTTYGVGADLASAQEIETTEIDENDEEETDAVEAEPVSAQDIETTDIDENEEEIDVVEADLASAQDMETTEINENEEEIDAVETDLEFAQDIETTEIDENEEETSTVEAEPASAQDIETTEIDENEEETDAVEVGLASAQDIETTEIDENEEETNAVELDLTSAQYTDATTPTWVSADDYSVEIFTLQKNVNQYVYVPIDDPTEIYGVGNSGNYLGKLYSFSDSGRTALNWTETNGVMSITSATGYREPDVMRYLTAYDIDSRLETYLNGITREELLTKEMQQTFYKIVESIKKYGGFYIGRYETGGLSGTAVVKKMSSGTSISSVTWYVMYEKCKTLGEGNDAVATNMIYGSLWDATLEWLVDSGATNSAGDPITYSLIASNSKSWGNYYGSSTTYAETFTYIPSSSTTGEETSTKAYNSSTKIPTGSASHNKVNNIYDLAGNVWEWTTEACYTTYRVVRGGYSASRGSSYPACTRFDNYGPSILSVSVRVPCSTLY